MTKASDFIPNPAGSLPIEWRSSSAPVVYPDALRLMNERALAIANGTAGELVWLLEHPPLYTAGTSADPADLVAPDRFPVYATGRGGQYTYHGPGQRVVYLMLDIRARGGDVRKFVHDLEAWVIATLSRFGIDGLVRPGRVGVWVERQRGDEIVEDKIAALGIRVSRGVSTHGIAINVAPNLEHFSGIVPCGITGHGVASLADLGCEATMVDVDRALVETFPAFFTQNA